MLYNYVSEGDFDQLEMAHLATILDYLRYVEGEKARTDPFRAQKAVALRWLLGEIGVNVPPPESRGRNDAKQRTRRVPWGGGNPEIIRRPSPSAPVGAGSECSK